MSCPVCGAATSAPFFRSRGVPVHANRLAASREEALDAPRGDLVLVLCERCTLVRNAAFEPGLLAYDERYETSLHFSGEFRRYAETLARRLVEERGVRGTDVLEIGCGAGEFLRLVCALGGNAGTGVDPVHAGREEVLEGGGSVRIVGRALDASWPAESTDLAVARHVLEHVEAPLELLRSLRRALRPDGLAYVEVPDALWTLREGGVLDLVYEHCSYFTSDALAAALGAAGLEPLEVARAFGGQYLAADARRDEPREPAGASAERAAEMRALCGRFAALHAAEIGRWRERVERAAGGGGAVALWGAGSKGVMLLHALGDLAEHVDRAVDQNPRKQGRFVPGTGRPVLAPEALRDAPPAAVLLPNPLYRGEVRRALDSLGVPCEVVAPAPAAAT